jgi:hypothetical protein
MEGMRAEYYGTWIKGLGWRSSEWREDRWRESDVVGLGMEKG